MAELHRADGGIGWVDAMDVADGRVIIKGTVERDVQADRVLAIYSTAKTRRRRKEAGSC